MLNMLFGPYADPDYTMPQPGADGPGLNLPLVDWSKLAAPISFHEYLNQLISVVMMVAPLLIGMRIIQCLINIAHEPDQAATLKKRIKNAILFLIFLESGSGIFKIVMSYF